MEGAEIVAVIGRQYGSYVLLPGNVAARQVVAMLGRKTLSYEALATLTFLGHVVTFDGTMADKAQAEKNLAHFVENAK